MQVLLSFYLPSIYHAKPDSRSGGPYLGITITETLIGKGTFKCEEQSQ